MIILFKAVLYIVYSLLVGGLLLESIPSNQKPKVTISKELLLWLIGTVPVITFVLMLDIIRYLSESIGYWETFTSVLFTFTIGKAWLASVLVSIILFLLVYKNNLSNNTFYARLGLFLMAILIGTYSFASHSASLYPVLGFLAHFIHVSAIVSWVGVLLYVSWSADPNSRWLPFLNWFTPFSIGTVLILTGGGLLINEIVAPQYVDSWVLDYGQALLIKHLLLIPLFLYAIIHSIYLKKSIKLRGSAHIQRSLKGETIIILFVFAVTGFLSQQVPPHEVWRTLLQEEPSPLFMLQYDGEIDPQLILTFAWTKASTIWAIVTAATISFTTFSIMKRWPIIVSVLSGLVVTFSAYMALISGVL
ncbi:copper resistance D family protein [Pseudalkalibacillus sp. SCS-8]|uniref:copper resistance D family protein n=1 Tax=Pseudalkalibacillus nanhaiensis TaxID=3115291 RepID=UPI0032DBB4D6